MKLPTPASASEVQSLVVVTHTTLCVGRIERTDLITCVRVVAQCLVAVSEALWHVQRPHVVVVQHESDMLEISWALGSQIDDDVQDGAARASNELTLRCRRILKMHAP
jgi:hypothetical protein